MANIVSFSPLMRSSVGFDRFNDLFESLIEGQDDRFDTYPPYNIEKTGEDSYQIVMAVAGFGMEDLTITAQEDSLVVTGERQSKKDETRTYLHHGLASRAFQRSFRLADYIKVVDADLRDGLLTIHLVREIPEEAKPRTIKINGASPMKALEAEK